MLRACPAAITMLNRLEAEAREPGALAPEE